MKTRSLSKSVFFALLFFTQVGAVLAQDSTLLSTEGVVGDVDQGRRAPVLTFSTEVAADGSSAKILADTQIINEEFKKYPISVEFYVNGKLFSKQFRSLELPAPLGIDVPKELAPMPFNYSIVATLLHPNRQYVTVAQGAIPSDSSSSGTLSCTVTETVGGDAVGVTVTELTSAAIGSDNTLNFTLTQDDQSAQVSLTVTPSSASTSLEASGTIVVQQGSSASVSYDVSGTVEASGSTVSAIEASSADSTLVLSCESTTPDTSAATVADDSSDLGDTTDLESTGIADVLNAAPGAGDGDEGYGPGPNGESNFIPIDKVDGVTVVN